MTASENTVQTGLRDHKARVAAQDAVTTASGAGPMNIPVLAGLLIVGFLFVALHPMSARTALVQVEQYAVIVYSAMRAAACVRPDRHPRYATLVTWLFVYTLFGLVQEVQLSIQDNPFHVVAPDSVIDRQLFIILLGCAAVDIVSTLRSRQDSRSLRPPRELSLRRTVAVSLVTLGTAPLFVTRAGGVHDLFSSRYSLSTALRQGADVIPPTTVIILAFANASSFFCIFSLLRLHACRRFSFLSRPGLTLLIIALAALNITFNNPISQPRYWIATMAIAVVLAGRWVTRAAFRILFVAGFVVVSVLIFPYLDVFRYAAPGQATIDSRSIVDIYVNKTDYASAQDIANSVTYVDRHGSTRGRQALGAALFFVPRSAWPDKPTDTAQLLAEDIGYPNLNIDSPLWAEGYVNFEYIGVLVMMGAWGEFTGRADRALTRATQRRPYLISMLVPALIGYELILLRGSLLQAMGRLSMMVLVGYLVSRRPAREPL